MIAGAVIDKARVTASFAAAADHYENAAAAQDAAAAMLAERVLSEPPPPGARILEIGCGTGLLTRRLLPRLKGAWQVTDIASAMVAKAAETVGEGAVFRVMDGEAPDIAPASLDLIVSNLAVQWFADLSAGLRGLARCLAPDGRMVLTLPGRNSFVEWRHALAAVGAPCGMPVQPNAAEVEQVLSGHGRARVVAEPIVLRYADGRAFLRGLKTIGAAIPVADHRPAHAGAVRRALAAMGSPCAVTHEILTVDYRTGPG